MAYLVFHKFLFVGAETTVPDRCFLVADITVTSSIVDKRGQG